MEFFTHGGSRLNLLGEKPTETDIYTFSNEKQVNVNTPPTILLLSDDDKVVVPENSIRYYDALKKNGIPATLYTFPTAEHGWGMHPDCPYHPQTPNLLGDRLQGISG